MGSSGSTCCSDGRVKAEELLDDVKEKGIVKVTEESAEQAQAAAMKLAEDAKSGKLLQDAKDAAASAQVAAEKLAEDAKSGKLQQDAKDAAASAQVAAAKLVEDAKSGKLEADLKAAAATAQGELAAAVATSVTITFEQPMPMDKIFTKRPLGFEYGPQAKDGCCASGSSGRWAVTKITAPELRELRQMGDEQVKPLKIGAVIVKINGVAVGTKKDKPEFDELIKKSIAMLPEA
ncbi:unnamed protein product [Polarella glacialis]|uniref:Uncharacterized protein n=1 Tax=Polarella glacialis TaxID=89957 RepID=A0A813LSG6_POLGL|nr:unnamed protein product [Polarella glacialis]|eukprot:CAMPEP_0115074234 /NCGR_PEP_ID=MMETSP0227-20121206/15232_1 /TAXON_ID=89957 /ORGANISM="Polarella glacialis, Strain CCMP 1383" /LENGTH=233 /DNA_ID=CAMNT_0002461189 /DNA_START=63 /DNA_END=764 /DNA_ORIENTATION=+